MGSASSAIQNLGKSKKAKRALAAVAVAALLFAGVNTALASWGNNGATGYDGGKSAEVGEPAIVFPIDTRVDGRLTENNGTKLPGASAYSTIKVV